jgi:hypothetical protein
LPDDLATTLPGEGSAGDPVKTLAFGTKNGVTIAGAKQAAPGLKDRSFLMFQNQSLAVDMRIEFGQKPSSGTGIIVPAGTTFILDVKVPSNSINVWAAAAGAPYAVLEAVQG